MKRCQKKFQFPKHRGSHEWHSHHRVQRKCRDADCSHVFGHQNDLQDHEDVCKKVWGRMPPETAAFLKALMPPVEESSIGDLTCDLDLCEETFDTEPQRDRHRISCHPDYAAFVKME